MDDKTDELRDIFLSVADDETVTEHQEETRGTLASDESSVDERLQSVLAELQEAFGLETAYANAELVEIVRGFYAGDDDAAIAASIGGDEDAVFDARMALHLVRDDDAPNVLETALRERDDASLGVDQLADEFDVTPATVERALAVRRARERSRRVSYRFQTAFEEILTDADLTVQFTASTHDDGLDDATAGAETNVEF